MHDEPLLTWEGYEHHHIERSRDWYWALGIIAIAGALISILFSNIMFALLIVVAAFTLALVATHPPHVAEFSLSERGLSIDGILYTYAEMRSFWIQDGERPVLFIDTPRFLTPDVIIPLNDIDLESLHSFLSERVTEKEMQEPFPYKVLEMFGF